MRLLVTGFPPFPGRPVNPTQTLVENVQQGKFSLPGVTIRAGLVPVEYRRVEVEYRKLLKSFRPDVVLAFGVGRQRPLLRLEGLGVNLDDCRVPDNAGEVRQSRMIDPRGPASLKTTLQLSRLRDQLRRQKLTTDLSDNAGRYLCNHLAFFGMGEAAASSAGRKFLFTHVSPRVSQNQPKRLLAALHIMAQWFHNQLD